MVKTFGFESTTDEVLEGINLSGKRVFITGVSALKRLARSSRMAELSSAPRATFRRRGAR